MQSFLSRIWIRVAVSISNDDNHYTTGNSSVGNIHSPISNKHVYNIILHSLFFLEFSKFGFILCVDLIFLTIAIYQAFSGFV